MSSLLFGIYGSQQATPSHETMRELTLAWSRYGYQEEIAEAETLEELLELAIVSGYSFCLVQRAGHVIYEQWYPAWWKKDNLLQLVDRTTSNENFLVMGQWEKGSSGCVGIKPDCMLVNLQQYKNLGRPSFGEVSNELVDLIAPALHAEDSSPLLATENTIKARADVPGWNFVQASFANNLPILPFTSAVNSERFDLTQGDLETFAPLLRQAPDREKEKILNHPHSSFLERVRSQTDNAQKGVFLFNIESYQDLQESTGVVDAVFSVAAGFKPNRILEVNGYTENTAVVFYDYSLRALEIRQNMVENWDGRNFPEFVRQIFERYPEPDTFYQLWADTTTANIDWQDVDHIWQHELKNWGGAKVFEDHWQQYRQLPHQYLHVNLLTEQEKLFAEVAKYKTPYLWWSNAFFTVFSNWFFTSKERKDIYEQWIKALALSNSDCRVNGADFNNTSVNGLKASQYFELYQNRPPDELKPLKLQAIEIRY